MYGLSSPGVTAPDTHKSYCPCEPLWFLPLWQQKSWSWEGMPPSKPANTSTPMSLSPSKARQVHPLVSPCCTAASLPAHSTTTALHRAQSPFLQLQTTFPSPPQGDTTRKSEDQGRDVKDTTASLVFNEKILQSPGLKGKRVSCSLSSQTGNNTDVFPPYI